MLVCLALANVNICNAATTSSSKEVLSGLPGVYVLVEHLQDNAKDFGLSADSFKTEVELRLRSLGITVLSPTDRISTTGSPRLYINVNTVKTQVGSCIYRTSSLGRTLGWNVTGLWYMVSALGTEGRWVLLGRVKR